MCRVTSSQLPAYCMFPLYEIFYYNRTDALDEVGATKRVSPTDSSFTDLMCCSRSVLSCCPTHGH